MLRQFIRRALVCALGAFLALYDIPLRAQPDEDRPQPEIVIDCSSWNSVDQALIDAARQYATALVGVNDPRFPAAVHRGLQIARASGGCNGERDFQSNAYSGRPLTQSERETTTLRRSAISQSPSFLNNFDFVLRGSLTGERIFNGRKTSRYPSAVALKTSNASTDICSGVKINHDTILTAAHCFCAGVTRVAYFGGSVKEATSMGTFQSIEPTALLLGVTCPSGPMTKGYFFGRDYAFLRLKSRVSEFPATRIASSGMIDAPARFIRVVGFGLTEADQVGEKRMADVAVASTRCLESASPQEFDCVTGRELVAALPEDLVDTCKGDSGGPAFVLGPDGKYYLAALTSRAIGTKKCGEGGIYTLVDDDLVAAAEAQGIELRVGPP